MLRVEGNVREREEDTEKERNGVTVTYTRRRRARPRACARPPQRYYARSGALTGARATPREFSLAVVLAACAGERRSGARTARALMAVRSPPHALFPLL